MRSFRGKGEREKQPTGVCSCLSLVLQRIMENFEWKLDATFNRFSYFSQVCECMRLKERCNRTKQKANFLVTFPSTKKKYKKPPLQCVFVSTLVNVKMRKWKKQETNDPFAKRKTYIYWKPISSADSSICCPIFSHIHTLSIFNQPKKNNSSGHLWRWTCHSALLSPNRLTRQSPKNKLAANTKGLLQPTVSGGREWMFWSQGFFVFDLVFLTSRLVKPEMFFQPNVSQRVWAWIYSASWKEHQWLVGWVVWSDRNEASCRTKTKKEKKRCEGFKCQWLPLQLLAALVATDISPDSCSASLLFNVALLRFVSFFKFVL